MNHEEMVNLLEKGKDPLKLSIKKWRDIVNHKGTNEANENCALCYVHRPEHGNNPDLNEYECNTCPVYKKTGKAWCHGTPLDRYYALPTVEVAKQELKFLQSLVPISTKKEGEQ